MLYHPERRKKKKKERKRQKMGRRERVMGQRRNKSGEAPHGRSRTHCLFLEVLVDELRRIGDQLVKVLVNGEDGKYGVAAHLPREEKMHLR